MMAQKQEACAWVVKCTAVLETLYLTTNLDVFSFFSKEIYKVTSFLFLSELVFFPKILKIRILFYLI